MIQSTFGYTLTKSFSKFGERRRPKKDILDHTLLLFFFYSTKLKQVANEEHQGYKTCSVWRSMLLRSGTSQHIPKGDENFEWCEKKKKKKSPQFRFFCHRNFSHLLDSLQCVRIFGVGALNNPSYILRPSLRRMFIPCHNCFAPKSVPFFYSCIICLIS